MHEPPPFETPPPDASGGTGVRGTDTNGGDSVRKARWRLKKALKVW